MSVRNTQLFLAPVMDSAQIGLSAGAPPLGLLFIAADLRSRNLPVEVFDGDADGLETTLANLGSEGIVGIYCTNGSYLTALEIAKAAKNRNNLVVLGGPYGKRLPRQILRNQEAFDIIGLGDGTDVMPALARGEDLSGIPSIAYRRGTEIIFNPVIEDSVVGLTDPDIDMLRGGGELYVENAKRVLGTPFRELSTFANFGCWWRARKGCIYCSTPYANLRWRTPSEVWSHIESMRKYNLDEMWVTSDDLLSDIAWMEEFAALKPEGTPGMTSYSRVNWITPHMVELLKRINMTCVFFGMESGSNQILRAYKKGAIANEGLVAGRLLAEAGIKIFPSFVLGAPGESSDTLQETIDFIERLHALGNVRSIEVDLLRPSPGSPSWDMMLAKLDPSYGDMDFVDMEFLHHAWVESFCVASEEEMAGAIHEIQRIGHDARILKDKW